MGFHIEHPALGIDKVINVQQVIYDLSKESPYDIESILISDLKTDDSRADSTHRQIATTAIVTGKHHHRPERKNNQQPHIFY